MHELARQHYLEAMGIQTYMPRWVLPAAPIPLQCDLAGLGVGAVRVSSHESVTRESVRSESATTHGRPVAAADVIQALLQPSAPVVAVKAKPTVLNSLPKAEEVVSFSVNLWQFAGLLVLADRHTHMALPVNVLLKNILIALGRQRVKTDKPEVIKWPLDGLSVAQAGPADSYFKSLLLARRVADQPATLLCFGDAIAGQMMGPGPMFELNVMSLSETDTMSAISLPSLETLIQQPALKADVWSAISSLRTV